MRQLTNSHFFCLHSPDVPSYLTTTTDQFSGRRDVCGPRRCHGHRARHDVLNSPRFFCDEIQRILAVSYSLRFRFKHFSECPAHFYRTDKKVNPVKLKLQISLIHFAMSLPRATSSLHFVIKGPSRRVRPAKQFSLSDHSDWLLQTCCVALDLGMIVAELPY